MKFNKLIPELSVSDIEKSLWFYADVLGFKIEYRRKEAGFAFISYKGSQLMIEQVNGKWETGPLEKPFGRGINFQIETDEIDLLVNGLKSHELEIKMMPKENWYRKGNELVGNREFLVMDPDGYLLRFAEDLGYKPVQK